MQKTAYERRISDGSSDVCSSDLQNDRGRSPIRMATRSTVRRLCEFALIRSSCSARRRRSHLPSMPLSSGSELTPLPRSPGARGASSAYPTAARSSSRDRLPPRSEEHTSELQSLMRISYAVFCLKKTKKLTHKHIM